jgi:hypothetical protein
MTTPGGNQIPDRTRSVIVKFYYRSRRAGIAKRIDNGQTADTTVVPLVALLQQNQFQFAGLRESERMKEFAGCGKRGNAWSSGAGDEGERCCSDAPKMSDLLNSATATSSSRHLEHTPSREVKARQHDNIQMKDK